MIPQVNAAGTTAAAGWLIFVGVIALFYELAIIVQRFVNIGIINNYITVFIIVVSSQPPSFALRYNIKNVCHSNILAYLIMKLQAAVNLIRELEYT